MRTPSSERPLPANKLRVANVGERMAPEPLAHAGAASPPALRAGNHNARRAETTAPPAAPTHGTPSAALVLAAFAAIYVIWGSTYLAIRIVVLSMPPMLSASVRFMVAGGVLYAWRRWRGDARPSAVHWRSAALIGSLMLLGGNGGVVVAETLIDSGAAALLVATVPLWMVTVNALRPAGVRPGIAEIVGLILGFGGVWVLVQPGTRGGVNLFGAAIVVGASLSWAIGSVYSRHVALPTSPLLSTAMQMLAGGAALLVGGTIRGEWAGAHPAQWTLSSLAALLYLVIFGSLIAFSAYVWLLRVSTPARVGTYAFVNPAVAVLLGWLILAEPLRPSILVAMTLITLAVIVITRYGRRARA